MTKTYDADRNGGESYEVTERTRVKRKHQRGHYDRDTIYRILDAGIICHVGYVFDGQPYVMPTAYWREGDHVYWHASSAGAMIRRVSAGIPVCFSVALLDGFVLASTAFDHSMNYRSVIAYGNAEMVADRDKKLRVLEAFTERVVPGRWAEMRPPTEQELKATTVVSLELNEVSAKVRTGPSGTDPDGPELPIWTGVVPVHTSLGEPEADPHVKPDMPAPDYLSKMWLG